VHSQIQLEITITAIKLRERARMPMEKQGANTLPKYIWLQSTNKFSGKGKAIGRRRGVAARKRMKIL